MSLSNDVLRTALATLQTLPAMSLSSTHKLDRLGTESLQQVLAFISVLLAWNTILQSLFSCIEIDWTFLQIISSDKQPFS